MESYIKIKASTNKMNEEFKNGCSPYYYVKYFNGKENYNGNDDEEIIFNCLIRHNEIGNRNIERSAPYTFKSLEEVLEKKCKEFEEEQKDNGMEI